VSSEIDRLQRLRAAGILSEDEFRRAAEIAGSDDQAAVPPETTESTPSVTLPANFTSARISSVPVSSVASSETTPNVSTANRPSRANAFRLGMLVAFSGVAATALISAGQLGFMRSSTDSMTSDIVVAETGVGPFSWRANQQEVISWLRARLGQEELLADMSAAACPSGATAFAAWSDATEGNVFRVVFNADGLAGYYLGSEQWDALPGDFSAQFTDESGLTIGSSLGDLHSKLPGSVHLVGPAVEGGQDWGMQMRGTQGFTLAWSTSDFTVRAVFAGEHWCGVSEGTRKPAEGDV
jgi:hypothetical protein